MLREIVAVILIASLLSGCTNPSGELRVFTSHQTATDKLIDSESDYHVSASSTRYVGDHSGYSFYAARPEASDEDATSAICLIAIKDDFFSTCTDSEIVTLGTAPFGEVRLYADGLPEPLPTGETEISSYLVLISR